ncbi:hypothetical protein [Leptolyngbya sp. PCC 6406]|uniref:hypothetical protein n=1 Tax=Leptolyngbya sp. PCC 6406 TaxID=1173264 RepID=UPI0002AC666B|nr:hypothetical protein [Leptolyngbya sp. PCC 6406]
MPTTQHPLRRGADPRLTITYDRGWKNIVLTLDGQELASYPNRKALATAQTFTLEDGSTLSVQFQRGLDLRLNGQPLPDSAQDPMKALAGAYFMAYFLAAMNLIIGFVFVAMNPEQGALLLLTIITAVIYGVLGYLIHKRRSLPALVLITIIYSVDTIVVLVNQAANGGNIGVVLPIRIAFLFAFIQGFSAIKALKQEAETTAPKLL